MINNNQYKVIDFLYDRKIELIRKQFKIPNFAPSTDFSWVPPVLYIDKTILYGNCGSNVNLQI